jgi:hypothetical protein
MPTIVCHIHLAGEGGGGRGGRGTSVSCRGRHRWKLRVSGVSSGAVEAPSDSSSMAEDRAGSSGTARPGHGQHGSQGQRPAVSGAAATRKKSQGWRPGDGAAATAEEKATVVHR